MKFKVSELINQGYEKPIIKLVEQLKRNHLLYQDDLVSRLASIPGATVHASTYDATDKNLYSPDEIKKAFSDLGINFNTVKGKRWYQFWKNNDDVKFLNALKLIN